MSRDIRPHGVLIVVEIRFYREGLADGLRRWKELGEIRTASRCDAAMRDMCRWTPAVVLLDAAARGGRDFMAYAATVDPAPRIIVLGLVGQPTEVVACAEAGAAAYVTRDNSLAEVAGVVGRAMRGELSCTPEVSGALMRRVGALAAGAPRMHATASLTTRETEVLGLIRAGMSNKEIGRELVIEVPTVKNHVHNILEKLSVAGRREAAELLTADSGAVDPGWADRI